jgi:hypothetical protein
MRSFGASEQRQRTVERRGRRSIVAEPVRRQA